METYSLLCTVPVFADVRRRLRRSYHSLKHLHRWVRLGLQLVEICFQLALLFSWPAIILCYIPIVVTDRVLHNTLEFMITICPAIMWPADDVYETVTGFVLSLTIGRILVFFLLLISYIIWFLLECGRVAFNFLLFFLSPLMPQKEEPFQALRFSPPPSHPHSSRNPHGHVYSPVWWPEDATTTTTPTTATVPSRSPSPPRTVVLPGAQRGPVRVVEAVARE